MSTEGLKLSALYSFGCDEMWLHSGFSDNTEEVIKDFLLSAKNKGSDIIRVRRILEKLEAYDYYEAIAHDNSFDDPFDIRIVRAYWLGDNFGVKARLFHNWIVMKKLSHFLTVGKWDSEAVKKALNCLVSTGQVQKVKGSKISVSLSTILFGDKFFIAEIDEKIERGFILDIARGDLVSVHLEIARQRISVEQAAILMQRTASFFKSDLGLPLPEAVFC